MNVSRKPFNKPVHIASQPEVYDAIVVGSGISGGIAVKELCELGLNTLLLERGRPLEHGAGYVTEHKPPWALDFRGGVPAHVAETEYPVQSRHGAFRAATKHYFMKDSESPYIEEKPYSWIRADVVGGRSVIWGRQSYRMSPMDFTANAQDGEGVDWPIRYEDLVPWYERVERYIGVSGSAEGLSQLPDSIFQPPMDMNVVERAVKGQIEQAFPDRTMIIGRTAVLTEALNGRAPCHYCGPCARGCSTASYYSTTGVALPVAMATGNLTVRANSIVHSVMYDEETGRASGVRVMDRETGNDIAYRGRIVFVCAATLGTAQILLNSTSNRFSNGIANSSGTLGRYLMDHHSFVQASGEIEGFDDRYYYGNRPNGIYIPRFRNIGRDKRPDFIRGYGFQGGAGRPNWRRGRQMQGFGESLKAELRHPGKWMMSFRGFGETLPRYENHCSLDPDITDDWGIPQLRVAVEYTENTFAMANDIEVTAAEMLEAAGAKNIRVMRRAIQTPGIGNHEMGSARMGRDPKTSVLNGNNQAHDVPNLFVTDGACMTSSACQNPSLTYMALSARAAHFAAEELAKGNL